MAKPEFCNASGNVQGGFLAAMLDDCMGPAILIATNAEMFPSTIDLNVHFLATAKPGLIGKGRVVKIGNTIGFVEAELEDAAGGLIARATSTVRITAMHKAVARPPPLNDAPQLAMRRNAVNFGSAAKKDIRIVRSPRSTRHAM
jgi:uncharacterized protein (TIGR00369 family)